MLQTQTRHLALSFAIGLLIYHVCLVTYSGTVNSDDELYIIDTTDSLAIRHTLLLNETVYLRGLQTTDVEPAQPILAIPLYWLAYHIPWVGNVHAIFLFNPILTALTAILLFHYARDLGYNQRTAMVAALLFGLTTIAWPYAKTFFREPLTALNLLAAAFCLERWRRAFLAGQNRCWLWLTLGMMATLLALLSKEAALLALPALLLLAYPGWRALSSYRRQMMIATIALGIALLSLALLTIFYRERFEAITLRYDIPLRLSALTAGIPRSWYGALAYIASPAKGIFWFSPPLLLAWAAPLLLPARRWRESWLWLMLMIWFAISYAAIKGELWHGGAGWGSRYMVPLTPFLMLASLPLLDRMLHHPRCWPRIALTALAGLGFVIQLGGLYVNLYGYYSHLATHTGKTPWHDSIIWSVRWSQAFGSLLYAPQASPNILWLIPQPDWLVLAALLLGLAGAAALLIWLYLRAPHPERSVRLALPVSLILTISLTFLALSRAYDDPRYEGHNQMLHDLRRVLHDRARPQDTIMLTAPSYAAFFMNYYKGMPTWYSLPLSPGERYSPEQLPAVVSDRVEDQIAPISVGMFGRFLYSDGVVWLVVDNSSFLPWSTRPVERYAAEYAFIVGAEDYSPTLRLVHYLPLPAPDKASVPARPINACFGRSICLLGYDLVINHRLTTLESLRPGDMLGVSLVWQATGRMTDDYTMAVYLLDSTGRVVLQQDRQPVGGFAPTSTWQPGQILRDNFGFVLPDDLPPGEYQIWTAIYLWPSLERLPVTGPDGSNWGDHAVLGMLHIGR